MSDTGNEPTPSAESLRELEDVSGIVTALGELPPGAFVTEADLARIFSRAPISIRRAVLRGELPPPVELLGAKRWTAGAIIRDFERRLAAEAEAVAIERQHRV